MQLDNELRNLSIGNLSITQYFSKIKDMLDLLANMEAPVSEKSLITYAVNGLGSKFDHVASIIRHRDPIPNFDTARFILLVEESILNRENNSSSLGSPSTTFVLITTFKNSNHELCHNFILGHCRFGDRCRFVHDAEATFGSSGPPLPTGFCYAPSRPHDDYGLNVMYTTLPQAFNTMTLQEGGDARWYIDTGTTSHLASDSASSSSILQWVISSLHSEFAMTDLGPLNYFLGIYSLCTSSDMFLSKSKYANEILERAYIENYNPCRTPVDTELKFGLNDDPVIDPTLYRSLAGALQYLTFTHPYITYSVQ
uniref:Hybrid signal transduction histidine kinase M n=1 Tax=Tanacetum cinerariifolium TaxID=118510 RepID=A0A6L2LNM2_TANCI|nr:hybrid signal transduction histidine kinase M [Tanacetum cinerariifolium]